MEENDAVIFLSDKMWLEIHAENVVIFIKMKNMLRLLLKALVKISLDAQ